MPVEGRIARTLQSATVWARSNFLSIRAQIDRTGLFPDLKGENGRQLRKSVTDEGALTKSYMLMCALSAGIATLGLLQSSTAVVIGAMLISPLMGPIAALGFAFASLDGHHIRDSLRVIAIGSAIGILTGIVLTWLSPIHNATAEIVARTEPTLLDLAIAILSGVAGAYATVQQKGATAIGVAIATALMPPLATVGYGIGAFNMGFALGAFLLFLTNLAAISFSFAMVARLSGAARPLAHVEITPRYLVAGGIAFLVLATPLALTLYRVANEARAQSVARHILATELGIKPTNIAQMQVKWPLGGFPAIDTVVVAPTFREGAESDIAQRLAAELGIKPRLNLQQVVAADIRSQTRAIVDAAVERSAAGIAQDVPPLTAIRGVIGLPVQSLWVNRAERTVQIVPAAAPGWQLSDYRALESKASEVGDGWKVRIIPPVKPEVFVPLRNEAGETVIDDSGGTLFWAISRWGVQDLSVEGYANGDVGEANRAQALAYAQLVVSALKDLGIRATPIAASPTKASQRGREAGQGGTLAGAGVIILGAPRSP